ncbi:hypothetical protein BC828DRAFT_388141 [Blastocladiella britannica]|nr:hypothetical protein BC828DRAFT_388141 [Blastocladiella britannica]
MAEKDESMSQAEFDILDAFVQGRYRKGPDGQPVRPSWALSEDNFLEEMATVPLFMRDDALGDIANNPELAALQALIYDGTPVEIATNFKNQGNDMFKDGRKWYPNAVQFYTQGLDQKCDDDGLNATLHCNRAAVHLELGNFRKCIHDCAAAIKLCPTMLKAYYRAGRAYACLEKYDDAVEALAKALELDKDNGQVQIALSKALQKQQEAAQSKAEREAAAQAAAAAEQQVAAAITRAGIQVATLSLTKGDDDGVDRTAAEYASHKPQYDPDHDALSFPALVLYPEFSQSDMIGAFDVHTTFMDQLAPILDGAPAPWDPDHTYTTATTDVYFLTFDTDPNKRRLVKVGKKLALLSILKQSWSRVVNGVVEFLVLHRENAFSREYVAKYRARSG